LKKVTAAIILFILLILPGCTENKHIENNDISNENIIKEDEVIEKEQTAEIEDTNEEEKIEKQENITGLTPNENGQVMILMYHRIGDKESTWTRSRENFLKDLKILYEKGYRLVSLNDYLNNEIDLPLGASPVILTFDDGTSGQFDFIENNGILEVDPDSAVGILKKFHDKYPDFGLEATFYVNHMPFNKRYWKEAVKKISDLGMDLGNHTLTHENLKEINSGRYSRQLGGLVLSIKDVLPSCNINSLALPFGAYPQDTSEVVKGVYEGCEYENRAMLLVGARPAPSPDDPKFNPLKLPRIRADEKNFNKWIDYFDEHPEKRYVSDGIAP
jgi:peptidoglycan/xylan/chitin deacetylase (PgdA/CDA1 family)